MTVIPEPSYPCQLKSFQFGRYINISQSLLKSRISDFVHNSSKKKEGSLGHTHLEDGGKRGYFPDGINDCGDSMYAADNICKMMEFLIDNIFVRSGRSFFTSGY